MLNFSKREWWVLGLGLSIAGAIWGALFHDAFLLIWNMIWVGIDIYVIGRMGE